MFEEHYGPKRRKLPDKRTLLRVGLPIAVALLLLFSLGAWVNRKQNQLQAEYALFTINEALRIYYERYQGYPDKLERLRGAEEGNPERGLPEHARLLPAPIAQSRFEASGYQVHYRPGQRQQRWAATVPLFSSYQLTAEPLNFLRGGTSYATDPTGEIVRQESGEESEPAGEEQGEPSITATPAPSNPEPAEQ